MLMAPSKDWARDGDHRESAGGSIRAQPATGPAGAAATTQTRFSADRSARARSTSASLVG